MKQNRTPVKSNELDADKRRQELLRSCLPGKSLCTPTKSERSAPVSVFPRPKLHSGRTFMNYPGYGNPLLLAALSPGVLAVTPSGSGGEKA
ncbi:MAG: hypothetical protein LAP85_09800 [Acidobacteriia bacterium]|nr:hypothetical protein [Terriglobia bacterium]